eukprot:TRINITY_DN1661_c0_g1_i3.p2 TRINITY_DN1661_c0_g1~~TRINITY_DN1661_c0_g1_i3.p2  ORF type:complete len:163 (+),score=33.72 TRINITY_DN1661_c0_g1_i3:82-570(+)
MAPAGAIALKSLVVLLLTATHMTAWACEVDDHTRRDCVTECFARSAGQDRIDCGKSCLERKRVAEDCAQCLGAEIDCSISNCLSDCMVDPKAPACTLCLGEHCSSCDTLPPVENNPITDPPCPYEDHEWKKQCGTECFAKTKGPERADCGKSCLANKGAGPD